MSNQKFGKYTLKRQLATGGMAEIWLAEQQGPGGFNKELVIKRILPHLAEEGEMTQMFFDEARIVAHLTHPNIGQVFELGEHDGDYFIAMEFIDGLDLRQLRLELAKKNMPLPISYAARIACDVLQALDYAHKFTDKDGEHVGLIHRDISPHNVLISNDGVVKLVDFGVAKATINTHKTETGAVKGKFAYMAPEQIEDKRLDNRVDIFALGCVFYELLTGQKPFGADLQAVSRIVGDEVIDPREHRQDIPDPVAQIITKALERDREKRFSSAEEMERAIEDYLRGVDDGGVGTRELSVMVRQVRDLPGQKPTEQLFGFEKQGVERKEPRITEKSFDDARQSASADEAGDRKTAKETPAAKAEQDWSTRELGVESEPDVEPRGVTPGLLFGFVAMLFLVVGALGVAVFLFISGMDSAEVEAAEAAVAGVGERELRWRHGEGAVIVFIDSDETIELYHDGELVGQTPFQTALRPGDYSVELRGGGDRRDVEIVVDDEQPVQSYRFEW